MSLTRQVFKQRIGLFVLFPVKSCAAGRRTCCHHKLPNLFALGPEACLRHVIVRAMNHFRAPQKGLVRFRVDEIGRRELGLAPGFDMHVAHECYLPLARKVAG